jgi:hypothetical protein
LALGTRNVGTNATRHRPDDVFLERYDDKNRSSPDLIAV